jgi:hypothetical protein
VRRTHRGASVLLAVPAYGGLSAGTAFSLFQAGADAELAILSGRCHVDDARNELVAEFLASDCAQLVFIDADVEFAPEHLATLIDHPADIVAGVYPKRAGAVGYPVRFLGGRELVTRDGLLEVEGVPAGFLKINRHVLAELARAAPRHTLEGRSVPIIFERSYVEGTRFGGDYTFCRKARAAGFRIHVEPELWLRHGDRAGSLGAHLRKKNMLGMGHALERVRRHQDARVLDEACSELHDYWCNPWACNASTLVALAMLAKSRYSILECGSGISTLVLAAANPAAVVHVLEDDLEWLRKLELEIERAGMTNVMLHHCPRSEASGWWYDVAGVALPDFDLVFVDGPAFHVDGVGVNTDTRRPLYTRLAANIENAVLVIDDANEYLDVVERFEHQIADERVAICLPRLLESAA